MRALIIGGLILTSTLVGGTPLKPYILVSESQAGLDSLQRFTDKALTYNNFQILGAYAPAGDPQRLVIAFTAEELLLAVQKTGGLTAFGAVLRVGITVNGSTTQVSVTNPSYWCNAYFQKAYPDIEHQVIILEKKLERAFQDAPGAVHTPFGSRPGLDAEKLQKHHYLFGREYFQDVVELGEFESFKAGKIAIEANLQKLHTRQPVHAIEIPGRELKLYGIGPGGVAGEAHFLPIIDIGSPRHTACLPYEILHDGKDAVMLHGRFRLALSFPDLTMLTFSKSMSTPGDIENQM